VILILSVVAASLYSESVELRSQSLSSTYSQVAATNAERGFQEAVRAVRNGDLSVSIINGTCGGGGSYKTTCTGGSYIETFGVADGGTILGTPSAGMSAAEGGGLQFSYVIFVNSAGNPPLNRYTIQSTGYAGQTTDGLSTVTAVVEGEIDVGQSGFKCLNAYDCTGG
jgi:hypothetical protein